LVFPPILALASAARAADVSADDITVTKAQPPVAATKASTSTSAVCSSLWDFVSTSCHLSWYGISIYGVVDMGVTWQSHAAPFNPISAAGEDYLIQKASNRPLWA
jgi:hypothetical protein